MGRRSSLGVCGEGANGGQGTSPLSLQDGQGWLRAPGRAQHLPCRAALVFGGVLVLLCLSSLPDPAGIPRGIRGTRVAIAGAGGGGCPAPGPRVPG